MADLNIEEVYRAQMVLKDVARHPKIIGPTALSDTCSIYLKPENLQHTGSFKLRGAYYKISQLSDEEKKRGVIACSAGNHAQGVALGATHNGIKSLICLPAGAPISKIEATKKLGAEVCLVPGVYDDAYAKALELRDKHGYTFVHPFDDPLVIAGQGTIGLEILEEMPEVEAIVVPVGGGGLISGVAYAIKHLHPECKVYGVQAAGAPSMRDSVQKHEAITLDGVATFADGIAVKHPGDLTYELVSEDVDGIVTVTDDEIAAAVLALMERQKLVTEGAGAVSVAAAMYNKVDIKGKRTVCLLSGGNIDVNILSRVITRGLVMAGRNSTLTIELEDKPGQLSGVSDIISRCGGNVVSVHHNQSDTNMAITSCYLRVGMETRDHAQVEQIKQELAKAGFKLVANQQ